MKREYSTKQRGAILDIISNSSLHITATEIINLLKMRGHTASVATVYRTLDKLTKEGLVKKMSIGENSGACYQYMENAQCTQHFHLKCIECGELIHLSCEFLKNLEKHIFDEHAFEISSGKTVIYGKCAKCTGAHSQKDTNCDCKCHF